MSKNLDGGRRRCSECFLMREVAGSGKSAVIKTHRDEDTQQWCQGTGQKPLRKYPGPYAEPKSHSGSGKRMIETPSEPKDEEL